MAQQTERKKALFHLVDSQAGYFTAAQARTLGYDYPAQHHHLRQGNWQRVGHGLFRLGDYPITPHEQLVELGLWSRDRKGQIQAVISHDTALAFHGLSDLLPASLYLTVPATFRKAPPAGVVLYRAAFSPADIRMEHGFMVTSPLRTLQDLSRKGFPADLLEQAVEQALGRGEISAAQAAELGRPAGKNP